MDPHRFTHPPQPLTPQSATSFGMHPAALHRDQPPTPTSATTPQAPPQGPLGPALNQMFAPQPPQLQLQPHGLQPHPHQQIDPRLDSILDPRLHSMLSPTTMAPHHALISMAPPPAAMMAPTLLAPQPPRQHAPLRPIAARTPSSGGMAGMGMPGQILAPAPPGAPRNGVAGGSVASAQSSTPQKDSDGKFPCPNCNKTYLHAKHLKRHLLRHTGDRPYQCILCKDTFSRSDILKRHFQKCSIRRGNPTGATHLSQHHANQQAKAKAAQGHGGNGSATPSPITPQGPNSLQASPTSAHHRRNSSLSGIQSKACDQCQRLKLRCDSQQPCERCAQRANECTYSRPSKRGSVSAAGGRRRPGTDMQTPAGLESPLTSQPEFAHDGYTMSPTAVGRPLEDGGASFAVQRAGQQVMTSLPGSRTTSVSTSAFSVPAQITHANQDLDWSTLLHVGEPHMEPFYLGNSGAQFATLPENAKSFAGAELNHGFLNGVGGAVLDSNASSGIGEILGSFPPWMAQQQSDSFQSKCDSIVHWLWPDHVDGGSTSVLSVTFADGHHQANPEADAALKSWITPDDLRHFVQNYATSFQGHFPLVHLPTFNPHLASNGLLMTIACIGAVYSNRGITVDEVRLLMQRVTEAMARTLKSEGVYTGAIAAKQENGSVGRPVELEEMQALIMMHILSTWHGNREQRDHARQSFPELVAMARSANFLRSPDRPGPPTGTPWNWNSWIDEEKRGRTAFAIGLLDNAYVIYFNTEPIIDPHEIASLPLPADDAAWDAPNANEAANAMGLNGPAAQVANISGSGRSRQLECGQAMNMLLNPQLEFHNGATNAYSKFILIHAIHMHIWVSQHQPQVYAAKYLKDIPGLDSCRLPKSDVDPSLTGKFDVLLHPALLKWKRAWDADLARQFPDPTTRVGFCRDGLPFFFLAKLFLHGGNRSSKWKHGHGDERTVLQVKKMLKHVQKYIVDGEGGFEPIGAVGAWDESYGVDELTFDMKLLFKPLGDT